MPRPCGQLEAIRDYIERIIIVSNQRRAAVAEPNRLTAPMDDRRWAIMAQNAMRKVVIADQGASFIVVVNQFRHVMAKCSTAFNHARGRPSTRSEIPAHSFISTRGEASPPCIARFILAHRYEMFEHTTNATKKARRLERHRAARYRGNQGEVRSGSIATPRLPPGRVGGLLSPRKQT